MMNWRLKLAGLGLPAFLKKQKLRTLAGLTARAFQVAEPELQASSYKARLKQYAEFTKIAAENTLGRQELADNPQKWLFEEARQFGAKLRGSFRVRNLEEAIEAARIIYRAIGIDFRADLRGEVRIRSCFFSRFYSPEICSLISSLDEGLLAGLFGPGEMRFSQRLTEGKAGCRATFIFKETAG
jgi:hypothetical protein